MSRIFLIKSPHLPISNSVYYFQVLVYSTSTVWGNCPTKQKFVPQSIVSFINCANDGPVYSPSQNIFVTLFNTFVCLSPYLDGPLSVCYIRSCYLNGMNETIGIYSDMSFDF
ncbi:hypothetical protein COC69_23245 [Bacillus cereus]|uniref:Uncharacterized protein n=1 Tax=Bacillus cereus TaxID=1396 RepID=A0A9X7CJX1_BACCE|nr:hypothetical protein COC69_23245 [Bacillus cereus]